MLFHVFSSEVAQSAPAMTIEFDLLLTLSKDALSFPLRYYCLCFKA